MPARLVAVFATVTIAAIAGCRESNDAGSAGACGPIQREALDPAYLVHVLGTQGDVEYTSDPPTSGPHQPSPPLDGVVDEPIPRPIQVGILERGEVLIQHDPDLPDDQIEQLRTLARDRVVVAPNADLPDPVVATAWLHKRSCASVDVDALREFVDQRAGKGPEA